MEAVPGPVAKIEYTYVPSKRQFTVTLLQWVVYGVGMWYFMPAIMKKLNPTTFQGEEARKKAKELLQRLGIKEDLNQHELQIASGIIDPDELNYTWKDVAGLDDTIDQINKTAICPILLSQNANFSALIQAPKGILLYGQPGVGKTLIAKAMTKEANCKFVNLDLSILHDKWYGESEKLTNAIFTLAQKIQPCIIFIDEIDSLLRTRSTNDHEVSSKVKAQFLSLWDGLITDPKKIVIVLGATNRPEDLDPAILRRMVCKFFIPVPGALQRRRMLDLILENERLGADVDLAELVELTDGFSGSDLKEVARSAAVTSLVNELLSTSDSNSNDNESGEPGPGWFQRLKQVLSGPSIAENTAIVGNSGDVSAGTYVQGPILMKGFLSAIEAARMAKRNCRVPIVHRIKP